MDQVFHDGGWSMAKDSMIFVAALAGALLFSPKVATAQIIEPDQTIIVEGTPDIDAGEARQQAREISFPRESSAEAFARFSRPICVGVHGLQPQNAQAVINRIYDNAEVAGIEINAEEGCGANVWVMIVKDPAATFEKLKEERSWMVRPLTKFERKRVRQQDGPVRAWNLTTVRDDSGAPVPTGTEVGAGAQLARTLGEPLPSVQARWASRVHNATRRDIEMSIILIARSALANVDAFSLADYSTMRALGRTEEPEAGEWTYDTVLNLFDERGRVDRLSAFDRAYLRSLYHGNAYRRASLGLASLKRHMEEELLNKE